MNKAAHDCKSELRQFDLKATPARIAVIRLFESLKKPLDAQYLITHLQETMGVDRVTVFRILNMLTEKGLLKRLELGEGKARYELQGKEHHHLICKQCGSIEDISDCNLLALEKEISHKKHFRIERHSLEFFGVCSQCQ